MQLGLPKGGESGWAKGRGDINPGRRTLRSRKPANVPRLLCRSTLAGQGRHAKDELAEGSGGWHVDDVLPWVGLQLGLGTEGFRWMRPGIMCNSDSLKSVCCSPKSGVGALILVSSLLVLRSSILLLVRRLVLVVLFFASC